MPRVLIVTSTYAPAMIADMHRARQLAWELPKLGWQVEILAPDVSYQPASCRDDDSAAFFAPDVPAHCVGEVLPRLMKAAGFGTIGWRALLPMARRGLQLLAARRFDLVYISTAQLPLFLLGPLWRRMTGVPYVLDLHDPGYRDDAEKPSWLRSGLKYRIGRWLAKHVERRTAAGASAIISVSASYVDVLRRRSADTRALWLGADRAAVIPFAVRSEDLSEAARRAPRPLHLDPHGRARIIYVGVGGPVMARSFALLCRVLARLRNDRPGLTENVTIALCGTTLGWRDGERCHLAEIASEHGLSDMIEEDPRRLSYRRSLEEIVDADGALVLGVDEQGYMPSKLFSYALSGKPLLACVHRDGPAFGAVGGPASGHTLWFSSMGDMPLDEATAVAGTFLDEVMARRTFDREAALQPFLAQAMAQRHLALFEACLRPSPIGVATAATAAVRA